MNEDTLLEFPCQFPIKVMGNNSANFENEIVMIVRRHIPQLGEAAVKSRPSKTGKYLSVTITFSAQSKAQIDEIYRAVHAHPEVRMML
ncbi:hypothetical protein Ga0123461_0554 [Mariprofundus aestuarium]|uniref:Uncharacterized protein n=1 Tax=Mariprofundus aestuarium TaxID=1921086 RepID=A0A2K8KYM1_MARES|nr:DUF493 domain-containing protein [Mariprofundus aestuarium]ATX78989.1 hypothetical protein Ga0123461_0554 [Mariprofundus aestuarium]